MRQHKRSETMIIIVCITFLYFFVLQEGSTCVHIAAMKGSVSVMKELLKFNPSGITTARNKVATVIVIEFIMVNKGSPG